MRLWTDRTCKGSENVQNKTLWASLVLPAIILKCIFGNVHPRATTRCSQLTTIENSDLSEGTVDLYSSDIISYLVALVQQGRSPMRKLKWEWFFLL